MKNTFELLIKLNLEELQKLSAREFSLYTQAFLSQLSRDFSAYVAPGRFDALKEAENWLKQVRTLALEGQAGISKVSLEKLQYIYDRLGGKGEDCFRLLGMYQAIDTVCTDIIIISTVQNYQRHLQAKLPEEGLKFEEGRIICVNPGSSLSLKQQKFICRYEAIKSLNDSLSQKNSLRPEDIAQVRAALMVCLSNKPDWLERPFLQIITDLLSLGLKPLYRAFFSKESKFKEQLSEYTQGPRSGGK